MTREIGGWLADGRLRCRETVVRALERTAEALVPMLSGDATARRS
jgi:NADPH-dependent curcumin reductase CurA